MGFRMSVHFDKYKDVVVVTVEGDLAGEGVAAVRQEVDEALGRGMATGVVFDLNNCDFVDSAGLEMLCALRRRCETLRSCRGIGMAQLSTGQRSFAQPLAAFTCRAD